MVEYYTLKFDKVLFIYLFLLSLLQSVLIFYINHRSTSKNIKLTSLIFLLIMAEAITMPSLNFYFALLLVSTCLRLIPDLQT